MANEDFSLKRDFKKIMWRPTLWVNFLRALFAGPVFFVILLLTGERSPEMISALMLPVTYFIFLLPMGLLFYFLSNIGVPFVGWMPIIFSVLIALGDPFVFLLHKMKPTFVPVYKFNFINFNLIIFVTNENISLAERL